MQTVGDEIRRAFGARFIPLVPVLRDIVSARTGIGFLNPIRLGAVRWLASTHQLALLV